MTLNLNVSTILEGVAVGIEATASAISKPGDATNTAMRGAATLVRAAASILSNRSPAEAIAILEHVRDHGAKPITDAELDAQTKSIIARMA